MNQIIVARRNVQHLINDEAVSPGLEKYVPEFYQDRVKELETIQSLIGSNDLESIRAITHRWKGYSAPYGFHTLARLGSDLEVCCLGGEVNRSQLLIKNISDYLALKGQSLSLV